MRQQRRFHDSDGIGAPEIRNFEVKLQSHSPKTRIGVLVAAGGFTREAINAVKRASRDSYSIALLGEAEASRGLRRNRAGRSTTQ